MKKEMYLICFFLDFSIVAGAQQDKKQIPKVNLDNFTPTAKTAQKKNKRVLKSSKERIPKVDLSHFRPPAYKGSNRKKD